MGNTFIFKGQTYSVRKLGELNLLEKLRDTLFTITKAPDSATGAVEMKDKSSVEKRGKAKAATYKIKNIEEFPLRIISSSYDPRKLNADLISQRLFEKAHAEWEAAGNSTKKPFMFFRHLKRQNGFEKLRYGEFKKHL